MSNKFVKVPDKPVSGWRGGKDVAGLSQIFSPFMTFNNQRLALKNSHLYDNIDSNYIQIATEFVDRLLEEGYYFDIEVDGKGNLDAVLKDNPKMKVRIIDVNDIKEDDIEKTGVINASGIEKLKRNKHSALSKKHDFDKGNTTHRIGRVYYNNLVYSVKNDIGMAPVINDTGTANGKKSNSNPIPIYSGDISIEDRMNVIKVALGEIKTRSNRHYGRPSGSHSAGKIWETNFFVKKLDENGDILLDENGQPVYNTLGVTCRASRSIADRYVENPNPQTDDAYMNFLETRVSSAMENFEKEFDLANLLPIAEDVSASNGSPSDKKSRLNKYNDRLSDNIYISKLQKAFIYDTFINFDRLCDELREYQESKGLGGLDMLSISVRDLIESKTLTCLNDVDINNDSYYAGVADVKIDYTNQYDFARELFEIVKLREIGDIENGLNPGNILEFADSDNKSAGLRSLQYTLGKLNYDPSKLIGDTNDYMFNNLLKDTIRFNENTAVSLFALEKSIETDNKELAAHEAGEIELSDEDVRDIKRNIDINTYKRDVLLTVKEALENAGAITEDIAPDVFCKKTYKPNASVKWVDEKIPVPDNLIDISIDSNGIIKWEAYREYGNSIPDYSDHLGVHNEVTKGTLDLTQTNSDSTYLPFERVSGYVGQVFVPDEYGLITTDFKYGVNATMVPCYTGIILPQEEDGEYKPIAERIRAKSFTDNLKSMIRSEIVNQFTLDPTNKDKSSYRNRTDKDKEINRVDIPSEFSYTALNSLYSKDSVTRVSDTFMSTPYISEETKQARFDTLNGKINLPKWLTDVLGTDAVTRYRHAKENGEDMSKVPSAFLMEALTGGNSIRVLRSAEYAGYVSTSITGSNAQTQGVTLYLAKGAKVAADGHIIKTDIDNEAEGSLLPYPGCPLEYIDETKYGVNNPADRQMSSLHQIVDAKAEMKNTTVASALACGFTFDDAYVISKKMADSVKIKREDGTETSLIKGDKLSDSGANKGVISYIVDTDMTEEEAIADGVYNLWKFFKDNPQVDAIGPAFSIYSRFNTGVAKELMDNPVSCTIYDENGNPESVVAAGQETIYALEQTADKKTTVYDTGNKRRKLSSSLCWAFSDHELYDTAKAFFADNKNNWAKFREYMIILGFDVAEDGTLLNKYTPREDIRPYIPEGAKLMDGEPIKEVRNEFLINPEDPDLIEFSDEVKELRDIKNNLNAKIDLIAAIKADVKNGVTNIEDVRLPLETVKVHTENEIDIIRSDFIDKGHSPESIRVVSVPKDKKPFHYVYIAEDTAPVSLDYISDKHNEALNDVKKHKAESDVSLNLVSAMYSDLSRTGGFILLPKSFGEEFDYIPEFVTKDMAGVGSVHDDESLSDSDEPKLNINTVPPVVKKSLTKIEDGKSISYDEDFYMIPVLPKEVRQMRMGISAEQNYHEYTYRYNKMLTAVKDYYKIKRKIENNVDKDGNPKPISEQNLEKLRRYIDDFNVNFESIQRDVISKIINGTGAGKNAFVREQLLSTEIDKSATAVLMPDPRLDMDCCKADKAIFRSLGLSYTDEEGEKFIEGEEIMFWRDPVLTGGALRAYKLYLDDSIYGVAINPVCDKSHDADYDGDTVGLASIPASLARGDAEVLKAVKKEVHDKLAPSNNLLNRTEMPDEETGCFPLYFNLSMDLQIAEQFSDEFKPSPEVIEILKNRHIKPVEGTDDVYRLTDLKRMAEHFANLAGKLDERYAEYPCGSVVDSYRKTAKSRYGVELNTNADFRQLYVNVLKEKYPDGSDEFINDEVNKLKDKFNKDAFAVLNEYAKTALAKATPASFYNNFESESEYIKSVYKLWQSGVKGSPTDVVKFDNHLRYIGAKLGKIVDPDADKGKEVLTSFDSHKHITVSGDKMLDLISNNDIREFYEDRKNGASEGRMYFTLYNDDHTKIQRYAVDLNDYDGFRTKVAETRRPGAFLYGTVEGGSYIRRAATRKEKELAKDGIYVDVEFFNGTYSTQEDKENTQTAIAARVDITAAGGSASQKLISALRDVNTRGALDMAYHVYQGILQLKHSAEKAKVVVDNVPTFLHVLCSGENPNMEVKDSNGNKVHPKFKSSEEMTVALDSWMKDIMGVSINKYEVKKICDVLYANNTPSVDDFKASNGAVLDNLAYQVEVSTTPYEKLVDYVSSGQNLFNKVNSSERSMIATLVNSDYKVPTLSNTFVYEKEDNLSLNNEASTSISRYRFEKNNFGPDRHVTEEEFDNEYLGITDYYFDGLEDGYDVQASPDVVVQNTLDIINDTGRDVVPDVNVTHSHLLDVIKGRAAKESSVDSKSAEEPNVGSNVNSDGVFAIKERLDNITHQNDNQYDHKDDAKGNQNENDSENDSPR